MSVAYLIRAHHRPQQLARLVERLAADSVRFFIHVSASTPGETFAAMRDAIGGRRDVTWTRRVPTRYGGYSLLEATLTALREIVAAGTATHVVQLSAQDYPLRPARELVEALEHRPGESLLMHFALPSRDWIEEDGGLDRIRYFHFERFRYRTRILRLPIPLRRMPLGYQPYGGSAFWALSGEAAQYVVDFTADHPRFLRFFRHTLIPDELYVPTVLRNSPLAATIANESIHHIEWPGGAHPKTLTSADFDALAKSDKLFARKFDEHVDGAILDRIDRELLARPVAEAR